MPYVSKAQHRFFRAAEASGKFHKGIAKRWADHTPDMKSLPEHAHKKGFDVNAIAAMGRAAAEAPHVEKFAAAAGTTPQEVRRLAGMVRMTPVEFAKQAYADPAAYRALVKLAFGNEMNEVLGRQAGPAGAAEGYGSAFGAKIPGKPQQAAGTGAAGLLAKLKGMAGRSPVTRGLAATGAVAIPAAAGLMASRALTPSPGPAPTPKPTAAEGGTPQGGGPGAGPGAAQGLSPAAKAVLGGGAAAAGGYGLYKLLGGGKRKKEAAAEGNLLQRAIMRAVTTKQAAAAREQFTSFLDKLAAKIPTQEKRAAVRRLQAEVHQGTPLARAIKVAYPTLTGEQRGVLAARLTDAACKAANAGCGPVPTTSPMTQTGPASQFGAMMGKVAG